MLSEKVKYRKRQTSKDSCVMKAKTIFSVLSGHSLPRNPVPADQMAETDLVGLKGVRTWDGQCSKIFRDDIAESVRQERREDFPLQPDGSVAYNILALSGGGSHGAFGAGFLCGWTKRGDRPKFKIVTGISTGALISPMAFVGSDFDGLLEELYTTVSTWNVYSTRNFISWIWNESFADTRPLEKLINKYVDETSMKSIAAEHERGRRLYIGTTNLDAQYLVVWNMGAIASSDHPDAIETFRKILLAAVSIPCIFPPVYFDVQADGHFYDEMHVDGSTIADVFICDFMLDLPAVRKEVLGDQSIASPSTIYIIRNDKLMPVPEQVSRNLVRITKRALHTLNKAHGEDHLKCLYATARQSHIDFNYIGIPQHFELADRNTYDIKEMKKLFDSGSQLAMSGENWHKLPLGIQ